jgi:UPF0755 protein
MEDHVEFGEKKPRKLGRKLLIAFVIILLLAAIAAGGLWFYVSSALKPTPASDQEVRVKIASGSSPATIAHKLEESGIIRNNTIFVWYLKWQGIGAKFQAGEYAMKPGMTNDQIVEMLNSGQTVKEEMIRVTIPEGYTVRQIADKLAETNEFSAEEFLEVAESTTNNYIADSYRQIPQDPTIKHHLEGYLFPETYEFAKGTTEEQVVERMLQELDKKLATIDVDMEKQLKKLGVSFHQMMTIASLVEREVVVDKERALVAGVIYNRINQKMPLQIDATVQYLFDKPKERLFEKDLEIDSPYNTYKIPGIPPGPIGSPSIESIQAALFPEETKYLFYVTKKDGSKEHLFAETFEGHKKNIAESKKQAK